MAEPVSEEARLRDSLWETWSRLLTLETNTIVKTESMSANKMGPLPEAVLSIARAYRRFIVDEAGFDLASWWKRVDAHLGDEADRLAFAASERNPLKEGASDALTMLADAATFERLRRAASHALGVYQKSDESHGPGDRARRARVALILFRILRNSAHLAAILHRLEDTAATDGGAADGGEVAAPGNWDVAKERWAHFRVPHEGRGMNQDELATAIAAGTADVQLPVTEMQLVRKIWEVGTEYVVLQTVIQLDGDVVTRIEPGIVRDQDTELVFRVHADSVRHSVEYWQFLVRTLAEFLHSLGSAAASAAGSGKSKS